MSEGKRVVLALGVGLALATMVAVFSHVGAHWILDDANNATCEVRLWEAEQRAEAAETALDALRKERRR